MALDPLLDVLRTFEHDGVALDAWSVRAIASRSVTLGTKDGHTGSPHSPLGVSEGLGAGYLLVWEDGRISRGRLEKRQIEREPAEAIARARAAAYSDPDAAQVLGPAAFPDVELYDENTARWIEGETGTLEQRHDLVRRRMSASSFHTWSGSFRASEATVRLVTSAGLDVESAGTGASWHVSLDGEWGDGHSARAVESDEAFAARIDRLFEMVGHLKRPAPPMEPGVLPVILHPQVVEGFVLGTLLHHLDGSTVAHGEGRFARDDFGAGHAVLREDLSLELDPLRPFGGGSYRFTAEGVPAARCTYLDRGRLVTPVLDLKYAKRLGLEPTPLPFSMDSLSFTGAELLELPAAMARADGGAVVLGVLGVHTQDPTSGDFSLSAPQTLAVGAGGILGRVRATLSGNVFDLLRSETLAFVRFEGESTPGLLIRTSMAPS